jgi:hypothetical protein
MRRRSIESGRRRRRRWWELHTAASAQNVRLVVALAERSSTLGCAQLLVIQIPSLERECTGSD